MYYISRGLCDHNELLYSCYNKSCDIIGDCKFCVRKALKLKSPVGQQQLYICNNYYDSRKMLNNS